MKPGKTALNHSKWAGKMKKSNRKVDLIIVIILVLVILAAVLLISSPGRRKTFVSGTSVLTPGDFNGRNIGVETGTHYGSIIKKSLPDARVFFFDNFYDLIPSLRNGQLDAFCADSDYIDQVKKEVKDITYLDEPLDVVDVAYAFAKNPEGKNLRDQVNTYLLKIMNDGTMQEIREIWLGEDDSLKKAPDLSLLDGKNGTLRMAVETGYEPFIYYDDNRQMAGLEIDLMYRFCCEYGYGLVFRDLAFDDIIPSILSGESDLGAAGMEIIPEREELVYFSSPHYQLRIVLAVMGEGTSAGSGNDDSLVQSIVNGFRKNFLQEGRWQLVFQGILTTLFITLLSVVLGSVLAFGICMFRRTGSVLANKLSDFYVKIMQGTPILVILMILYYIVFAGTGIETIWVAITGFTFSFGAFASEIMRTGIDSVDNGQREAALALGYKENKAFFKFIFPQAMNLTAPVYEQEIIALLQETSVVGYIAIEDVTKIGDMIRARTYDAFFPLIMTAVIYFFLTWVICRVFRTVMCWMNRINHRKVKRNERTDHQD